ncbi:MAG: T9SS type A sorting domain-containing protein [Bacteroidetes bacterium]|nr:T9SS type A sorting domain-containing protein [Bacteroidota bacterium]
MPTYFGDQYLWTLAQVKNHGCVDVDTANIFMVEGVTGVGPGMLQGTVLEGPGFGRLEGDPIPGIDIKLGRNPGGALVTQTTTNATGQFTFDNIDINTPGEYYTVYVDLPGRERDSTYNVIVTASNTTFNQLDYAVDSNSVYPINPIVTSIGYYNFANENKFSVYPNPFNENTTIAYTLSADAEVRLEIYNVLGVKIQNILSTKQQAGEFKYVLDNKINAGVYFISLTINNKTATQRVVKMK